MFNINLLFNCYALQSQRFAALKEKLKENTALLVWNCLRGGGRVVGGNCLERNDTKYSVLEQRGTTDEELLKEIRLINTFFVRIVKVIVIPLLLLSSEDNLRINCSPVCPMSNVCGPWLHRMLWSGFLQVKRRPLRLPGLPGIIIVVV